MVATHGSDPCDPEGSWEFDSPPAYVIYEIGHYWLLSLSISVFSIGTWLCWTGITQEKPVRLGGVFLLIVAAILLGIFQDVRLDHLCAIHQNCSTAK